MVKMLRSFIQEKFPLDLRLKFDILSRRRDIIDEKSEEILKLLHEYNVGDVTELGPGTNRYAFRLDGFVVKVATDRDGKIDNLKEFKMAKRLYPYVAKTYEVSKNGILLVAEYIPPFSSYSEMLVFADSIRNILTELSSVYLIGDVGISSKNFGNWGVRTGTKDPVCLDFAYVYEVSSSFFVCRKCKAHAMLVPNKDFTTLYCSNKGCARETSFEDIRVMIGNDVHRHEIGDLSEEGYEMHSAIEEKELTVSRSNYLAKKKKNKEKNIDNKNNEEYQDIAFVMEHEPDYYLNKEDNQMSLMENAKVAARAMVPEVYHPGKLVVNVKSNPVTETNEMEADDDLAFSATVGGTTTKTKSTEQVKIVSVSPVNDQPTKVKEPAHTVNETKSDVETSKTTPPVRQAAKPERNQTPANRLSDEFIDTMYKSISKLACRIQTEIWHRAVFDEVKSYCKTKNMYPQTFYQNVQNAVFRAITSLLGFIESTEPNTGKPGKHKIFIAPDNIRESPYINTVIFIERLWNDKRVSTIDDPVECLKRYDELFSDCTGIERDWIPFLKEWIRQKMNIDNVGVDILADRIAEVWCVPETDDVDVEPEDDAEEFVDTAEEKEQVVEEAIEVVTDEHVEEHVVAETPVEEPVFSSNIERHETIAQGNYFDEGDEEEDDYQDDEDEAFEDEEDATMFVTVQAIMGEEGYDIIRLNTGEPYGSISIPFYTRFDRIDVERDRVESMVDPRNGIWDWLIHTIPDNMFTTKDPDKYMKVNDVIEADSQIHIVILDKSDDDVYTMGIYCIAGIHIYDDSDQPYAATDPHFLEKLNIIISKNIGFGDISHLKRTLERTDLIRDEEYIRMYLEDDYNDDFDEGDEEEDDYQDDEDEAFEDEEDANEDVNIPVQQPIEQMQLTPEEMAALSAIMNSNTIPDYNGKPNNDSKDDDNDLFTPVTRRKG